MIEVFATTMVVIAASLAVVAVILVVFASIGVVIAVSAKNECPEFEIFFKNSKKIFFPAFSRFLIFY